MFYVSLNWITLFTGGRDSPRSDIFSYEPDTDTWQEAGTMTVPREDHAVAVFPDVSKLCPWWSGGLDINARAREGRARLVFIFYFFQPEKTWDLKVFRPDFLFWKLHQDLTNNLSWLLCFYYVLLVTWVFRIKRIQKYQSCPEHRKHSHWSQNISK